jgi:hypothetical protein
MSAANTNANAVAMRTLIVSPPEHLDNVPYRRENVALLVRRTLRRSGCYPLMIKSG